MSLDDTRIRVNHRCDLCGRLILWGLVGLVDHYRHRHPVKP